MFAGVLASACENASGLRLRRNRSTSVCRYFHRSQQRRTSYCLQGNLITFVRVEYYPNSTVNAATRESFDQNGVSQKESETFGANANRKLGPKPPANVLLPMPTFKAK